MLSSKEAGSLYIYTIDNKLHININPTITSKTLYKDQHLYLISERKVKEGDWCLHHENIVCKYSNEYSKELYKKIEATTDELKYYTESSDPRRSKDVNRIPQIPQSFIEAYVKANGDIKEVNIEMTDNSYSVDYIIKTRPDNTVIINPTKTYTRQEVEYLLIKCFAAGCDMQRRSYSKMEYINFDQWLEENF